MVHSERSIGMFPNYEDIRLKQLRTQNKIYRRVFAQAKMEFPYNFLKNAKLNNYRIPRKSDYSSSGSPPAKEYSLESIVTSEDEIPQLTYSFSTRRFKDCVDSSSSKGDSSGISEDDYEDQGWSSKKDGSCVVHVSNKVSIV